MADVDIIFGIEDAVCDVDVEGDLLFDIHDVLVDLENVVEDKASEEAPSDLTYCMTSQTTVLYGADLIAVHSLVRDTFHSLSVEYAQYQKSTCSYPCSAMKDGTIVEFDVAVYPLNKSVTITLLYRFGSIDVYSLFVLDFNSTLQGLPLPLIYDIIPPLPEMSHSLWTKCCSVFSETLSDSTPHTTLLKVLWAIGTTAEDKQQSILFSAGSEATVLLYRVAEVFSSKKDNIVRATAMASLVKMSALPVADQQFAEFFLPTLIIAINDPYLHVRREALCMLCTLAARYVSVATSLISMLPQFLLLSKSVDPYISLYGSVIVFKCN
jgi:hypothetical protein